ncbi:MAG: DUF4132 domain-containing protein [Flammeovirgaceae bacterium]
MENKQQEMAKDGFILAKNHPYAAHHEFISHFYETGHTGNRHSFNEALLYGYIRKVNKQEQVNLLLATIERFIQNKFNDSNNWEQRWWRKDVLHAIWEYLLGEELLYTEDKVIQVLQLLVDAFLKDVLSQSELNVFFPIISHFIKASPSIDSLKAAISEAKTTIQSKKVKSYHHSAITPKYFTFLLDDVLGQYDTTGLMKYYTHDQFGAGALIDEAMDDFPYYEHDPLLEAHQLLSTLLQECKAKGISSYNPDFRQLAAGKQLMDSGRPEQLQMVKAVFYRLAWYKVRFKSGYTSWLYEVLKQLMKKKLPYQEADFCWIAIQVPKLFHTLSLFPFLYFAKFALGHVKKNGTSPALLSAFNQLKSSDLLTKSHQTKDREKIQHRLLEVIDFGTSDTAITPVWLNEKDQHFGKLINNYVKGLDQAAQNQWFELLKQLEKSSGSKPSAKFQKSVQTLISAIGTESYQTQLKAWFQLLFKKDTFNMDNWRDWDYLQLNKDFQKGFIWSALTVIDHELIRILAALAERCFQTIPERGPLAAGLGNAILYVLGNAEGLESISQLSRLKLKIKQNNTRKLIARYIQNAANRLGITEGEIEDMATPDFGLIAGRLTAKLGETTAVLQLEGIGKTSLQWEKSDGKLQKSVPAAVKKDFMPELKQLRATAKEIQKTLTAQRDRLDRSYIQERSWDWEKFQKYFLNHGLMAYLAKRLIWQFHLDSTCVHAIWEKDGFVDAHGQSIDWDFEKSTITLWHPIYAEIDEILAWRSYLDEREIQQPLKQAYREVYFVTDAERNTHTYSNRFAAHLLKQYQFNTLAKLRGWNYSLMGAYDDGIENTICSISLPAYDLTAEFWIDELASDEDFADSGIWLYVATDQVRFKKQGNAIAMDEVPKMAFSEIMRDADLFVGVASIGNDPNWEDHGNNRRRFTYWESYSFGELTESAQTRKAVLERLIPRLKIAKQCRFDQKFLIVAGDIRTYKIHLGSGNILMTPNDQYLCIVPQRQDKSSNKVFLPFEGDKVLSIILSKAMLLANDTAIDDPTIVSQIRSD